MQKIHLKKKNQFLFKKRESAGLKHFIHPKTFIEYSSDLQDVNKNIEENNKGKTRKNINGF